MMFWIPLAVRAAYKPEKVEFVSVNEKDWRNQKKLEEFKTMGVEFANFLFNTAAVEFWDGLLEEMSRLEDS